ncbi:MAG: hypothetical protein IT373_38455 [Polyangiaceae bacterium]|nr:hypothetical protein [Polyangiaceae bacterium]
MTIVHEDPSIPPLIAAPQSFVADPVWADTVEVDREVVSVGAPTTGPNRLTMHVPTEATVLSLGAASGRWNTDLGIVGYTDSHIHFETKAAAKTVLSLGGPATVSAVAGYAGKGKGPTCPPDPAVPIAPLNTHGYSMVTEENAWHDSIEQHYLLSKTEDITFRTLGAERRAVIQAERGSVDVIGFREVDIAAGGVAITSHLEMPYEDVKYEDPWTGETPHSVAGKVGAAVMAGVNAVGVAASLLAGAAKIRKEYKEGHLHASADTVGDIVEWLTDAGEGIRNGLELHELCSHEEAPEKSIKIDAEEDFGSAAGGESAFFGITGAGLCSGLWTSVSSVGIATMKGLVFAGVGAAYTSLKGYVSIEVACDHGNAIFEGHHNVTVSSEKANLFAAGKRLAQVSSKGKALFGGDKKAWIGTSAGGGWGAIFEEGGILIGKANAADTMATASIDATRCIKFDKEGVYFTSAGTTMKHDKRRTVTEATDVKFHAKDGDVKVDGKKVLIDGP